MSEDQKQALIGLCKIEIKRWKAASESDPNMRYMVELMGVALSALTAKPEPVGFLLEYGGTDRELYPSQQEADKMRREVVENGFLDVHLSPLFTHPAPAADLAELVPDGWKLVPGEPTKEMVAAGQDRFEECIDSGFDSCEDGSTYEYSKISSDAPYLVYIAMLAAAPEVG